MVVNQNYTLLAHTFSMEPLYFLPESEINGHVCVTGSSGSGKTVLLGRFAGSLSREYPTVIISPHSDLPAMFGGGIKVTEDGMGGCGINPISIRFDLVELYGVAAVAGRAVDVIERGVEKLGAQQRSLLFDLFRAEADRVKIEGERGCSAGRMNFSYLERELLEIAECAENSRKRSVAESLLDRLKPLSSMPIFSLTEELDVRSLLNGIHAYDVSRLRGKAKALVCDALFGLLSDYLFSLGPVCSAGYKHRIFLVVDEAKVFFGEKDRKECPDHPLNRIATEGRKYGVSLIAASQRVEHFSEDFLGSAALQMVLGPVTDTRQKKKLSSVYGLGSHQVSSLSVPGRAFIESSTITGGVYYLAL